MDMEILTAEFVLGSDVFEGCRQVYDGFCDNDPDCSWGDNNRSLVRPDVILESLPGDDVGIDPVEIETVRNRLESLPAGVMVDLEN